MEINQDEHHQINTCYPEAAVEHINHENGDSLANSEIPTVQAGAIDACIFTSPVIGNPTYLLNCPTASENSIQIPEEGIKDSIIISEANPNCGTIREGIGFSVENIDNKEEISVHLDTAEKIILSRERKKSKYLCYPFIALDKGSKVLQLSAESEIDDFKIMGNGDSSSVVKCSKKKKSLTSSVKIESLTASSSELLMQLRTVAIDHLTPYYDTAFDPTEILFNRFRESVFSGISNSEILGIADTQNQEDSDFSADDVKQNKKTVRKTRKEKPPSDLYDVNVNIAKMKPQRKRKSDVGSNTDFTNEEPTQKRGRGRPKRMKKKETSTPGISYINGNSVKPISLEVCLQDAGPYPNPNSAPFSVIQTPEKSSAEVTINQMKQSLMFMTAMLEKSATTISPETRANLEIEIKNLLKKVNPVVSSSS